MFNQMNKFGNRAHFELRHDPGPVHLDRLLGCAKFNRNLFVQQTANEPGCDFALPRRQSIHTLEEDVMEPPFRVGALTLLQPAGDGGNEIRGVQSLSGGESFLVSLALALGLSSMSAHDVRVRPLLIDEGFGTLDPATLDSALAVLDALQATGRQVGVISHVPALVERVGAHVRVVQRGGGRSEVIVA